MGFVTRSARVEPELCEDTGNTADQAAGDPTDPGEIARDETNRRFPGGQTIGGVNLPSPAPRALRPYGESGARPYDDDAWDALDDIKQDTTPRVNPFLSDELIDSIKQAYVAGLGGDTVARFRRHSGESLDGQLANRARPGDCSVDEFATCNLGYQTRGGVGSYPGNHQYDASTDNTTGGSLFPSAAPAPVQSLSQAVVNALAKRRLEESKVTNAEKMEARIRGRVHYSGGSTGGFDPPFPKSPVKSKDETAETETTSVAARRESDDSDSDSDNDGAEPDPTSPGTKKSASNSPRGGTPRGTRRKKTISSLYDQHLGRRSKAGRYFRKSRVRRVCVRFAKQAKKLVSKIVTSEGTCWGFPKSSNTVYGPSTSTAGQYYTVCSYKLRTLRRTDTTDTFFLLRIVRFRAPRDFNDLRQLRFPGLVPPGARRGLAAQRNAEHVGAVAERFLHPRVTTQVRVGPFPNPGALFAYARLTLFV